MKYFQECGNGVDDIIVKTDQEPAIKYLFKDIVLERADEAGRRTVKDIVLERADEAGRRTLVEESPVGSSGSNGMAEWAVRSRARCG